MREDEDIDIISRKVENELPGDFHRGITKDELMIGIEKGLREMFLRKQKQAEALIQ